MTEDCYQRPKVIMDLTYFLLQSCPIFIRFFTKKDSLLERTIFLHLQSESTFHRKKKFENISSCGIDFKKVNLIDINVYS